MSAKHGKRGSVTAPSPGGHSWTDDELDAGRGWVGRNGTLTDDTSVDR
jgi:hypothetical protein